MTSDATMLAEGVAVLYCRLALARHDDPLPLDLIADVTAMEAPPGITPARVAEIATRMRRVAAHTPPSWWDVAANPDDWLPSTAAGIHPSSSNYRAMRLAGVPHVHAMGSVGALWHRPELEAWAAENRGGVS